MNEQVRVDPVKWSESRERIPGNGPKGGLRWKPVWFGTMDEESYYKCWVYRWLDGWQLQVYEGSARIFEEGYPTAREARLVGSGILIVLDTIGVV